MRRFRSRSPRITTMERPELGLGTEAEAVIALDDNPFPDYPDFQFGLVGEEFTRRPARHRATCYRRGRQGPVVARAERSAGPHPSACGDDPGRRLRAERAGGLRDLDPADPAAFAGHRVALAIWRRRGTGGCRSGGRGHRARPEGCPDRGERPAVRTVARDLGVSLVFAQRHVAAQIAYPQPADRRRGRRCRHRGSGEARPTAAGRTLPLGGHRRRQRRAVEPALSRRLVGRGRAAGRAGQARGCRSTSRAISPARPPSCSSRRRSPARRSWRSPRTGFCRCAR